MTGLPPSETWLSVTDPATAKITRLERELDAARARVAELEAELVKVEGHRAELSERCYRKDLELDELRERHAAPAAETTNGEQALQFHCTHSTHEVLPLRCGGRHYGLPCGPGCAPVVP